MLTEKQINKFNSILENKVFKYQGPIVNGAPENGDIEYKIKLLGYRKMISVGDYYDYLKISVNITGINNKISRFVFGWFEQPYGSMTPKEWATFLKDNLYQFKVNLESEIRTIISIFDTNSGRIIIDEFNITAPKTETLTESRMSRQGIRTVVQDIVNVLKNGKKGFFYLPDDDLGSYEFSNIPFSFNVELTLKVSSKITDYKMNGFYSPEDDVIELVILFNPKTLNQNLYNIIGELNEIIAHELEHGNQAYYGEFPNRKNRNTKNSLTYYSQEHEIPAQYQGFKRLSKLRKEPFPVTVKNWFDTHKDIHGLTDTESEEVINLILNYKK